jgi:hypothetical protein
MGASQTTDPNDPNAVARKRILEDKLFKETAPELAPALDAIADQAPAQEQPDLTQMQ